MGLGRHGGGADLHAVYDRFDVEIRLPTVPERAYESIIHLQTNVLFGQLIRIPAALLAALIVIPYWQYPNDTGGVWFASHKGRRMAAIAVMAALFVTPICIVVDEIAMDSGSWMPDLPPIVAQGILPVGLIMAGILVFLGFMRKKYAASSNELVQTVFVLLVTVFMVLTITGYWFRGEEMALMWPWDIRG